MLTHSGNVRDLILKISEFEEEFKYEINPPVDARRLLLVQYAEQLAAAARYPEENLYCQATQVFGLSEQHVNLRSVLFLTNRIRQLEIQPLERLSIWVFLNAFHVMVHQSPSANCRVIST